MNKIKSVLGLAISIALAFTFSCSSGGDGDGNWPDGGGQSDLFNKNPQIYNMDGTLYKGSGIIKLYANKDEEKLIENAGNVTRGIVNLKLPPKISDEYLFDFMDDDEQQSCTYYPKGLKTFFDDDMFTLTDNNGEYIGTLYLVTVENEEAIFAAYFSEAGKITCNYDDHGYRKIFNIDAKKGWNVLYYSTNGSIYEFSTNNILKKEKDIKWFIYGTYNK